MEDIRQCERGHLSLGAGNWQCPWCEVERWTEAANRHMDAMNKYAERNETLEAEVARLEGLLADMMAQRDTVTLELLGENERHAATAAEIKRLEGLIVRCFGGHYEGEANAQLEVEARRIRGEK